jgi:hypothetical protein
MLDMETNEIMTVRFRTVRFEACVGHVGDVDEPCDVCGWCEGDHGREAMPAVLPGLPLAA